MKYCTPSRPGTFLMTRRQRLRRVGILCCHFLRNLAFYRAGWRGGELRRQDLFWINVNGNFLDVAVLEWCKLFGDKWGQQSWRKVITDHEAFMAGLLASVKMTEAEFGAYIDEMKTYRDKFVAHLDELAVANIPRLRVARKCVSYLYDYLRAHEQEEDCFHDAPPSAAVFYRDIAVQGRQEYGAP